VPNGGKNGYDQRRLSQWSSENVPGPLALVFTSLPARDKLIQTLQQHLRKA